MSTKSRRKNTSVVDKLTHSAYDFTFVQAVHLLERWSVMAHAAGNIGIATNPVAGFKPPATEAVRFNTAQSLSFPSSEVSGLVPPGKNESGINQWRLTVSFIGLTGIMGVLPHHYTELVLSRLKEKDASLERFLDIFNHRTTSLFFQSSVKYRLPLQYARSKLQQSETSIPSPHTQALLSVIGLGTEGVGNRLHISDEALIGYAGLLSQKIRTADNLKQLLRSYFGIPVTIDQFVGQWQDLIDGVRSRLPDIENPQGRNVALGQSAMLGGKGWFTQGKIRIVLGPLDKLQLKKFAPGTNTLKALNEMVRTYVNLETDYEFVIRIYRRDIPEKSGLHRDNPPVLGWNAWLNSKHRLRDTTGGTMDISVSPAKLG